MDGPAAEHTAYAGIMGTYNLSSKQFVSECSDDGMQLCGQLGIQQQSSVILQIHAAPRLGL